MKKALIVAHVAYAIDLFNIPNIILLKEMGYEVSVACNFLDRSSLSEEKCKKLREKLDSLGVKSYHIDFQRNPLKPQNLKAFFALKKLVKSEGFDLIHCHTPVGGILTRLAAVGERKKGTRVIYTAHGFHFFKGAPLINWLIYYTAEKFCSYFTDTLITINGEDFARAKEKLKAKNTVYLPGIGIDCSRYDISVNREEKLREIGVPVDSKVILHIGELSKRKNQKTAIQAFDELNDVNAHLLLVGIGELNNELCSYTDYLGIKDRVHFLGFRTDIPELLGVADIFIFPSRQEGLPVALMEAMASGLPCICSDIRGNNDLVDEKGGFLLIPDDYTGFATRMAELLADKEKRIAMGEYNKEKAKNYDLSLVREITRGIYSENE